MPIAGTIAIGLEGAGQILVDVHQVVRDLEGAILADGQMGHLFTFRDGLMSKMEIPPSERRISWKVD